MSSSLTLSSSDLTKEGEEESPWLVGTIVEGTNDSIEWNWLPPQNALYFAQSATTTAHIVWNSEGVMEHVCSASSNTDTAAIMKAYQQEFGAMQKSDSSMSSTMTVIDRTQVNEEVEQGMLPAVAPYASQTTQYALVKIMEMIFYRQSVSFFAAAPLRMTSIYHFDTDENVVALTFDDAPCRFPTRANSCMTQVLDLLHKYGNAKATFMIVDSFARQKEHEPDLIRALQEGHEFANHGLKDESFKNCTPQEFSHAVDKCNATIKELQSKANLPNDSKEVAVPYFRAPHAYYTKEMEIVLQSKGMRNVMCDSYGSCPIVQDSNAIADLLLRQAKAGSILLIHMPERGFRGWTLPAIEMVLQGLQKRGTKVVTLSQLQEISKKNPATMLGQFNQMKLF
ncbi:Chitooligosaccharide deacetylase [Seminavis robusta]|uniref:Chitooligosaccharide deacetylase n=1 Tax=Seminavis robusta TaxID=568900 RepID=A0A9N8HA80_9STRA|nr:Chitooligosaccharide deacetylase [Seminavis robusta]|eukprot:Sro309_g113740.1 Chitooligosaccharide deacetylase (396) ;mRNA; f:22031-23218